MSERKQTSKTSHTQRGWFRERQASRSETTAKSEETSDGAELEGLLDEIDELLESNAENFVKSYVQKGGQ